MLQGVFLVKHVWSCRGTRLLCLQPAGQCIVLPLLVCNLDVGRLLVRALVGLLCLAAQLCKGLIFGISMHCDFVGRVCLQAAPGPAS